MFVMIWHARVVDVERAMKKRKAENVEFPPYISSLLVSRALFSNGFSIKNPHKFSLNFNSIIDVHCAR